MSLIRLSIVALPSLLVFTRLGILSAMHSGESYAGATNCDQLEATIANLLMILLLRVAARSGLLM